MLLLLLLAWEWEWECGISGFGHGAIIYYLPCILGLGYDSGHRAIVAIVVGDWPLMAIVAIY